MKKNTLFLLCCLGSLVVSAQKLTPVLGKTTVETYDYQEITLKVPKPAKALNPFTDTKLTAMFVDEKGVSVAVEGFCDAPDGTLYKVRYMPSLAGKYFYKIIFSQKGKVQQASGTFLVVNSQRNGPVRVDTNFRFHFVYENSGQHFFWNSTTTYWLLGWKDEKTITAALDRLAALKINRIRVAINARASGGPRWAEPNVLESENFTFKLNPWLAKNPDDLDNPAFDVTRFNLAHWQKLDRLVAYARAKNIQVSLIFYVDGLDHGCDPFKKTNMGNEDEQRYYRYAVARCSAFANVMWDVANEYHLFRNEAWVEKMGTLLKSTDPVKHLISVHGNGDFPFRKSHWVDLVLYQSWDECGGYEFMRQARDKQIASGTFMPQVNEEYGYEDTYPTWGCGATASKTENGRSADNRRRLAWEICMAGGYQTTGERANDGTGAGKDTGGGWINGRGNPEMTMLRYYGYLQDIFSQTEYWKMTPQPELVDYGNLCLALPGEQYLVYSRLSHCRLVLPNGNLYTVTMYNPRTGTSQPLPDCDVVNGAWQYPKDLSDDWVFVLNKK